MEFTGALPGRGAELRKGAESFRALPVSLSEETCSRQPGFWLLESVRASHLLPRVNLEGGTHHLCRILLFPSRLLPFRTFTGKWWGADARSGATGRDG